MRLLWTHAAWDDYLYWQEIDPAVTRRINELVKDALRTPFKGIGKPESLKGVLAGWWSRRITGDHRLVYRVSGEADAQQLEVAACRYHADGSLIGARSAMKNAPHHGGTGCGARGDKSAALGGLHRHQR